MKIDIRTIPHSEQRYETSGDWLWQDDTLNVRVSHLSTWQYEFCLALHETVEGALCRFAGITHWMVDEFDMPYEAAHQRGDLHYPCGCLRTHFSDPGNDKHSPYWFQHRIADAVERIVAAVLGINWADYDAEVDQPPK